MTCNKLSKPVFTREQISECENCRHASGKKIWCCLLGCSIIEVGKIIERKKSLILPHEKKPIKPPTITDMAVHFTKAMGRWAGSGFKTVDRETYIKRRIACSQCQPTGRCPHCGCNLWAKAALATETCIEGKW